VISLAHGLTRLGGLKTDSVAKTAQIRAIQVSRFIGYHGRLDKAAMAQLEDAVKITLALR